MTTTKRERKETDDDETIARLTALCEYQAGRLARVVEEATFMIEYPTTTESADDAARAIAACGARILGQLR